MLYILGPCVVMLVMVNTMGSLARISKNKKKKKNLHVKPQSDQTFCSLSSLVMTNAECENHFLFIIIVKLGHNFSIKYVLC